jgi:hypothetical protein
MGETDFKDRFFKLSIERSSRWETIEEDDISFS